ncbi:MAG: Gfo/Idh/MocA family oxidoreductase [Acidobacteria bacterium]|nr:Gfo/Idh/MocA family oxidoreductase [Acidobacteriota bacterium]
MVNRRYFVMGAAAVAGRRRAAAASDKVTVCLMGVGGRGQAMAQWFGALPDVRIPLICDVDENVIGKVMKMVTESQGQAPRLVTDIRRVLDDKSVDAIVMATPLHWHAPGTILACDAGKDVYVEKPASHNIREGRLMVDAARRNQRIVQMGIQARSRPVTQRFVEYVQSGKLGRTLMAKVWNVQMRRNIGRKADEPVPAGVDYDIWTGPLPKMPFNRNRYHATVNWHWHYGTGDIGNDGVHWLDIARWAMGAGVPRQVSGMGSKLYFDDDQQTPDTMNITYDYGDRLIHFEQRLWNRYRMEGSENAVAVYGDEGMAQVGRWQGSHHEFRVFDNTGKLIHSDREPSPDFNYHARNFIDCVKSRKPPTADIEAGHLSTVLCHLGNIVARTGRAIRYDANAERIVGDAEAQRLVARQYRQHWSTPKGV